MQRNIIVDKEIVLGPADSFDSFLIKNGFPEVSISVMPFNERSKLIKNLKNYDELYQAMLNCFNNSMGGKIILKIESE